MPIDILTPRFLTWSGTSSLPRARRQWTVTALAPGSASHCDLCQHANATLYTVKHRDGATYLLDAACILASVHIPGVDARHPKRRVWQHLRQRLEDAQALAELGAKILVDDYTSAEMARLQRVTARYWHWPRPIPAKLLRAQWSTVVQALAGVPPEALSEGDLARLRDALLAPVPGSARTHHAS